VEICIPQKHQHAKTSFLNQLHHADSKYIPTLSHGDSLATSVYDKENCLNNQFYSNFNHSYPPLSIVPQQGYTNPEDCPNVLLCTEDEVFELILGLDCRKSSGPYEISARVLKVNHCYLTVLLPQLFTIP